MADFRIGDEVRIVGGSSRKWRIDSFADGKALIVFRKKLEYGMQLVKLKDIVLVEPEAELQQAIREVMLSKDLLEPLTAAFSAISVQAIAKAVADELRGGWADRLTEPVKRSPLADGLVGVWVPAKQAEAPWTPKVGDWVKVTKPVDCAPAHEIWWVEEMNIFDGKVMRVTSVCEQAPMAKLDSQFAWEFDFAWLAPAEDPRGQPATTKQYRDPTKDDLKNGPIACEYREHDGATWKNGFLVGIIDAEYPFHIVSENDDGHWELCRIEVK
jgi:hypothetical protein